MITRREIADVRVEAPSRSRLGARASLRAAVVDDRGEPLHAVVPIQVEILDPEKQPAEFSGYYGAKDGRLSITLDFARDDPPGEWTIRVKELASGRGCERRVQVMR